MRTLRPFCLLALIAWAAAVPAARAQDAPPILNAPTLSLRDALKIAARSSVTLRQMRADAAADAAAARGANALTKPSLSTTTYGTVGDSPNILTTSPGVTPQNLFSVSPRGFADQDLMLMVPLFTGGRLDGAAASAREQGEAAALSVRAAGLTVTEAVTEGYADAALQQALVDVAQARLTAEDEQVRVTQEEVATGRSAPVDLLREQAEQADARQGLLAAQNDAALALVNLKAQMGVSQVCPFTLSDTLDTLVSAGGAASGTFQDALRQAEAHRPELASAQKLVEAAQSNVSAAQGESAPQVYGVAMGDATAGQDLGRVGYTVGLTASLPLYDGGQRRADVDGAKARLERALADAQQARQTVDQDVATAWLNRQTASAQVTAASAGVTAAQQGYDLATLRYNAGKSTTAERLDALAALTRAQGDAAQAMANLVVARARLSEAMG